VATIADSAKKKTVFTTTTNDAADEDDTTTTTTTYGFLVTKTFLIVKFSKLTSN